jgi:hypothetical protein
MNNNLSIEQQNIILHNSTKCLSPQGNMCSEDCTYSNCDKYKCEKIYSNEPESYFVPPEIPIPLNVFTIGTVNVDETTYMFSPKVLDRANVIEFNNVDFKSIIISLSFLLLTYFIRKIIFVNFIYLMNWLCLQFHLMQY